MVCLNSTLFDKQTGDSVSRLDTELVNLFGRQVVAQSKKLRLEDVAEEAELVAESARQLIEATGKPERQRAIVGALSLIHI